MPKSMYGKNNSNARGHKRGETMYSVLLSLLYDRDNGRCGICHKHISIDEASIDHIVPKKLGGKDIASNVQLSHLSCNQSRGVGRLPVQMRVIETKQSYTP